MNWIFGDNINTDLITPGRYNVTTDATELARIVFIEYRPDFAKKVKKNDFVIAGNNFGCGSSRETAVLALQTCQIKAIIAKSFARIFYRNCMNLGLLAIIADITGIDKDDQLIIDLRGQQIKNITKNKIIEAVIPKLTIKLHQEKGIIAYIQKYGLTNLNQLFE